MHLLSAHHQRLEILEKAGLSFLKSIPYDKEEHPPNQLFRPESCVLSFIERDKELKPLRNWINSEVNFSLKAYSGAGDIGKSRLAASVLEKFCLESRKYLVL